MGMTLAGQAQAATLPSASDTATTSRPSASAPLTSNQAANDTQVNVFDNGSFFIASDTATLRGDTGETTSTVLPVASMSGQVVVPAQPDSMGGLKLWLKADAITGLNDGDPVGTWNDSSGNGNNAAQSTAANKPTYKTSIINSQPIVRFDGSNDRLDISSIAIPNDPIVFVIAKVTGTTTYREFVDYDVNASGN